MVRTRDLRDLAEELGVELPPAEVAYGHEDNVANLLYPILEALGYEWTDIVKKPRFTHPIIGQPREADLGILRYNSKFYGIIVELKTYGERLTEDIIEKLAGYCGLAGALYGIWTNGQLISIIKLHRGIVKWDYVTNIPDKNKLVSELQTYTPPTTVSEQILAFRLATGLTEEQIEDFAEFCHNLIRSRRGLAVPDRIYEFSKLLVARIIDERRFREGEQDKLLLTTESIRDLRRRRVNINTYVNELLGEINKQLRIFSPGEGIDLPEDVIESIIERLDEYPLWSESLDVLGHVYERFLMHTMTGSELGQYFTPRTIVELMVEMVDPSINQRIVDPAAGTGGFLIYSLKYIQRKHNLGNDQVSEVAKNIYGIDVFETVVKLSKINVWLNGNSHENIVKGDSLDPENSPSWWVEAIKNPENGFDIILTNPPFGAREGTRYRADVVENLCRRWEDEGVNMFEVARYRRGGAIGDVQPRSLFIEACIKALKKPEKPKEGGILAIVMDNGTLSNIQKEEPLVRRLIRRECVIEAVIGLPKGTFKPYGSNVIPSILLLRRKFKGKWRGEYFEEQQEPIFRVEIYKIGFVPAMTRYRIDSDRDIHTVVEYWRKWRSRRDAFETT
ncbi:hypothetical protein DRP04_09770 [Archaeoglobales archaeon]|nr:MAG: hypothetical protein DRP04_09770 [Archaeoglobales archaeon]